jgi:hypothetical protein
MFGMKVQGRLGNQLFQYAYARVLSEKFNTPWFFLKYKDLYIQRYFDVEIDAPWTNRLKAVKFYLSRLMFPKEVSENQMETPETNIRNEQDGVIYNGYYQSEKYHLAAMADLLKKDLKVKAAYRINIRDYVPNNKPNIVVHIRRTDYVTWGGPHLGGYNLTLPLSYYQHALSLLPHDCNIVFLSDDMDFVKENFHHENAIYSEKNSEIVDFQLIMQADYLVLANSSFSWWGAYLNSGVKKVISPKYWIGFKIHEEHPNGINCQNWITIE